MNVQDPTIVNKSVLMVWVLILVAVILDISWTPPTLLVVCVSQLRFSIDILIQWLIRIVKRFYETKNPDIEGNSPSNYICYERLQVLQFGDDRQITLLTKTAVLYFDNFSGGVGVLAIVSIYFLSLFEKYSSNKCF